MVLLLLLLLEPCGPVDLTTAHRETVLEDHRLSADAGSAEKLLPVGGHPDDNRQDERATGAALHNERPGGAADDPPPARLLPLRPGQAQDTCWPRPQPWPRPRPGQQTG